MEDNNENYYKDLIKLLEEMGNEPVFFWGASLFLQAFLKKYSLTKYNILGIIDKDTDKIGTKIGEYTIYPPKKLKETPTNIVLTILNNNQKIYNELQKEIQEKRFFVNLANNFFSKSDIKNKNNKLYLVYDNGEKEEVDNIPGLSIEWKGENSTIEIGASPLPKFKNCRLLCINNSRISIASSEYEIQDLNTDIFSSNSELIIGKNFSTKSISIWITVEPNKKVIIGDDCMFSHTIIIRTSDAHTIYDIDTRKVLNNAEDIIIGNHVWIGQQNTILKGSVIPDNSIIGAKSLVNKKFDKNNTIIAGVPAKVVKSNVNWDRKSPNEFY